MACSRVSFTFTSIVTGLTGSATGVNCLAEEDFSSLLRSGQISNIVVKNAWRFTSPLPFLWRIFIGTVLGDAEDVGSGILVQEIKILFVGLEVRFMQLLLLQLNFKKMYI